jgi:hypothetical protein
MTSGQLLIKYRAQGRLAGIERSLPDAGQHRCCSPATNILQPLRHSCAVSNAALTPDEAVGSVKVVSS